MKKLIPVLVVIILVGVIAAVTFGDKVEEKYSYSDETVDMNEYFGRDDLAMAGEDGKLAIVLQNELVQEIALVRGGQVYFDMATVKKYFNSGFYVDEGESLLLYTSGEGTLSTVLDSSEYTDKSGVHSLGAKASFTENDKLYLSEEYLHRFANFSVEVFDRHLQLKNEWGVTEESDILKDTQVRLKGGIKSPILREIAAGETVTVLEQMETWTKVKTSDALIGYVENKRLGSLLTDVETPIAEYVPAEYASNLMDGKVSLGWHAIYGTGGNDTLGEMLAEGKGMNVIAPTWFSFTDSEGNFRSFAGADYVKKAHAGGLKVWGVWDDFNYRNETGSEVSTYQIFSSTTRRNALVRNMVDTTLAYGLDGINLDFELITAETGPHFVQFLKELSLACHENGIVLSVDNYMPNSGNTYYRLDVQGQVCDYVILMGYDEHWHGCGDPGSVASIGFITDGIEKTLEKVAAEKVINAVPFYTILWKTEGAEVTDSYVTVNNMEDFLSRVGKTPEWDETTCQNYAEWESGSALYQIWLEDADSLKTKLNVMSAHKLGGVAVWRLGYGTPVMWQLIDMFRQM